MVQARKVEGRIPCVDKVDIEGIVADSALNYSEDRIEEMKDELREECEERITAEIGRQKQLDDFGLSFGG